MSPNRWQQMLDVFNHAVEKAPAERAAHLDDACAGNPDLRAEVESMLAAYDDDPTFLETPVARLADLTAPESIEGRHMGPYRILRRLGEGGMGVVYLAERADGQFHKHVALKVIKWGMDTEEILRRFQAERQILASLDHPNVARLLDGGVTDDGRPYFVMEYAEEAVPIDAYCRQHRLSIDERLTLFRQVCQVVHVAHQNLVVHRDLKPSNVVVTANGQVKLLDFGIAKLIDPDRAAMTAALTRTEARLMTPEYAAPEQVRGEPVTTATDGYALGVLLYALLTDQHPYQLAGRTPREVEQIICEHAPTKPSAAVQETGPTATQTEPARLSERRHRQLRGDLDTIVMKAMHKDPTRRYASVEALAEDIRRYLDGHPVTARPDTTRYRLGKFVRRHRLGVVTAAGVVLLVLGFGISMAIQSARIARQAQEIARERDRAEAVSTFLADLFRGADPTQTPDPDITAREILLQGTEKVRQDLAGQPDVQLPLLTVIGSVYRSLGLYEQSQAVLQEALTQYQNRDTLSSAYATTLLELANVEYRLDHFDAAEPLLRKAVALQTQHLGPDHPDVAKVMNTLAIVLDGQGRLDEAKTLLRRVIAIRRSLPGEEPNMDLAANLNNLATILHDDGALDEAEPMYREALSLLEAQWGDQHPYIAFLLNSYAGLHQDRGDYERAYADFQRALGIAQDVLGEAHPFTAVLYHNLARLMQDQQKYAEAAPFFQHAIVLRRQNLPPDHPDLAESLRGLGQVQTEAGQPTEAESVLREALSITQRTFDADHWRLAQAEAQLGQCLARLGAYGEAEDLLQRSYQTMQHQRGPDHRLTIMVLTYLIDLYTAMERPEQAASYHQLLTAASAP